MTRKLKLLAEDGEDLAVISAALQDAVVRVGDMTYLPKRRRFALVLNRFVWEDVPAAEFAAPRPGRLYKRARAGLHLDGVMGVKTHNIPQDKNDAVLSLLAIGFDDKGDGSGQVSLTFAGGGVVRLDVECVDAVLDDLGPTWTTRNLPQHEVADGK